MCAHPAHRSYSVYILTNKRNGTLYVGVTNDLKRRVWQHKSKALQGFTKQYGLDLLVHCEQFRDVNQAIGREKETRLNREGKRAVGRLERQLVRELAGFFATLSTEPKATSDMTDKGP
jgi:putative endonuclease